MRSHISPAGPQPLCSWECFCTSDASAPLFEYWDYRYVPLCLLMHCWDWSQAFPHAGQALYQLNYIPSLGPCFKCWYMKRKGSVVILSDEEGLVSWLESAERGISESSLQWADGNLIKFGGFCQKRLTSSNESLFLVRKRNRIQQWQDKARHSILWL